MSALTTLPAPAATAQAGIPAAKPGAGAGSAAGFGDALLALLAGPATENGEHAAQPAMPGENELPEGTAPPAYDLATQAAPAQLVFPAAVTTAPDPVTAAATETAPVTPADQAGPQRAGAQQLPAGPAAGEPASAAPGPLRAATGAPAAPAQAVPALAPQASADPASSAQPAAAELNVPATLQALPAAQPATPRPANTAPRQATVVSTLASPPVTPAPVPGLLPPSVVEQTPAPAAPAAVSTPVSVAPPVPAKEEPALPVAPRLPGADTTPVTVPSAPAVQLAPTTPAVAAATPQAPAVPVPAGYTANLAKPLFSLATAGPGEHTMTVSVNPEKLGPVTVQAHVSGGNVRIELFAATADGREVLRQTLPELRRDLAGAGINASLDLSSNSQSGSPHGGQDRETFTRRAPASNHPGSNGRPLHMNDQIARTRPAAYGPDTVLDVLA